MTRGPSLGEAEEPLSIPMTSAERAVVDLARFGPGADWSTLLPLPARSGFLPLLVWTSLTAVGGDGGCALAMRQRLEIGCEFCTNPFDACLSRHCVQPFLLKRHRPQPGLEVEPPTTLSAGEPAVVTRLSSASAARSLFEWTRARETDAGCVLGTAMVTGVTGAIELSSSTTVLLGFACTTRSTFSRPS